MWISNATLHIIRNGKLIYWLAFLGFLSGFNMPLLKNPDNVQWRAR